MKIIPLAGKLARLASHRWSISARFESADTLNDEDRASVVEIARQTLAGFLPDSASKEKT